jgi:hypothetical protein
LLLTAFDPVQGKPGSRFALPAPRSEDGWDLSPNGTEVVSLGATSRPVLMDLGSQKAVALRPETWTAAQSVAWSADGKGWIVTRPSGIAGSEVLYVDRSGPSRVLWTSDIQRLSQPIVSADGHIAFSSFRAFGTVWMLRGF